jgi:hypothetical protein
MKRNELVGKVSDVLFQFMPSSHRNTRNLIADVVLTEIERNQPKKFTQLELLKIYFIMISIPCIAWFFV